MTRDAIQIMVCDGNDGYCGEVVDDFYAQAASRVNGAPVTAVERHPGWTTVNDDDFCPRHKPSDPSTKES